MSQSFGPSSVITVLLDHRVKERSFTFKDSHSQIGPTRIVSPFQRSVVTSAKFLLVMQGIYSQVQRIQAKTSLGSRYSAYHILCTNEIKIVVTMRHQHTLVRLAIIKKSTNNKRWIGCGEKGTLLVGMQIVITTMENSVEIPLKIKTEQLYDSAILLLGI